MAEGVQPDDPASHSSPLKTGTQVGSYTIGRMLRRDEVGITYAGRDSAQRDVAITEYLPLHIAMRQSDAAVMPCSMRWAEDFLWGRNHFLGEARILGELSGTPAIVGVDDALEANGTAYTMIRRVRGQTLASRLARHGTLPRDDMECLLPPLLDGLESAHARNLLHLGITPSSIMLDRDGRPTLIDFRGMAAALAARRQITLSHAPGFAAVELVSDGHTGPATDIYALAATLYRCVTSVEPLPAINRLMEQMTPATQQAAGRYPYGLLAAIDAGLAFRSAERPAVIAAWRPVFQTREPIPVPSDVAALAPMLAPESHGAAKDALEPQSPSAAIAAFVAVRAAAVDRLSSFAARINRGDVRGRMRATLGTTQVALRQGSIALQVRAGRWRQHTRKAANAMWTAWGHQRSSLVTWIDRRRATTLPALARVQAAVSRWTASRVALVRGGRPRHSMRAALETMRAVLNSRLSAFVAYAGGADRRRYARARAIGAVVLAVMGGLAASNTLRSGTEQVSEAARADAEAKARADAQQRQEEETRLAEREAHAKAEAKRQQEEAARRAGEERARAEAEVERRQAAARRSAEERVRAEAEVRKTAAEKMQAAAIERQQAEAAERALALSPRDRRRVQVALTALSFDTAGIDEIFGPRTRQMIGLWQKRQGAADTGFLTGLQLAALLQQAAPVLAQYDAQEIRPNEKPRRVELADTPEPGQPQAAATTARGGVSDPLAAAALALSPVADPAVRSEEYRGSQRVLLYGGGDPRMYAEYTLTLRIAGAKVSGVVTRYCPACAPNGGEERKDYPCGADTLRSGGGFSLRCDPVTVWGDLESARIHHSANLGGIAIPLMRAGRGG